MVRSQKSTGVSGGSAIGAGREVLLKVKKLLDAGQSLTVETTLSGNTYLHAMSKAKALGYLVVLIYIGTIAVSINMERVRFRVAKGGHDIPEGDQLRRFPRSMANASKALRMADEAVILDNSTSAGYVKVAVKRINGMKVFEPIPAWASFLRAEEDFGRFRGLTVNERLFAAGLLEEWDAAIRTSDRDRLIEILTKVYLADQATQIANKLLG